MHLGQAQAPPAEPCTARAAFSAPPGHPASPPRCACRCGAIPSVRREPEHQPAELCGINARRRGGGLGTLRGHAGERLRPRTSQHVPDAALDGLRVVQNLETVGVADRHCALHYIVNVVLDLRQDLLQTILLRLRGLVRAAVECLQGREVGRLHGDFPARLEPHEDAAGRARRDGCARVDHRPAHPVEVGFSHEVHKLDFREWFEHLVQV
mmetsp:Transcript_43558/g.123266  ORF Transcript_43558/g.123266 Transcript_43558/m.123266 type:complete len:210 (-) Transcript_43558:408-1037(-)